MEKVRMGVIGVGNMGTAHCKNIYSGNVPGMELTAICDASDGRETFCKETFPDVPFFKDYKEMLSSGLCDAVTVATPHYQHPQMVMDAFEAGLHVMVEKPVGVYTKQVLEMNEAAKKSGKVFGAMFCIRTFKLYQKLKEMVESGALGHIKRINWTITDWYRPQAYHDSGSWRSTWADEGGGALINQNPHQLDLWQWMFGMPDRIMAHVSFGKYYDIEVEDDLMAYFEYENGTTGTYITSTGEAPGTNRLEVACDMGRVVIENGKMTFDRNVVSEREFNKNNKEAFATPECWKCEIPGENTGELHVGIFKDFASAILHGTPLLASGYDGINGLTISNAIHYSAWTGGWADVKNFPHDEFCELLMQKVKTSKKKQKVESLVSDIAKSY